MRPVKVTAAAKAEFLGGVTSIVSLDGSTGPKPLIRCSHQCLKLRSSRTDHTSCNGFIYEDNSCKLGYMDPNRVWEVSQDPGEEKIYADMEL